MTSSCPRREFSEKRYGGRSEILWPSQDAPVEKEEREESAGTGLCVDAPADQDMEAEDEKNMEELSFVPSGVSESRWALHRCATTSEEQSSSSSSNLRLCKRRRRRSAHD